MRTTGRKRGRSRNEREIKEQHLWKLSLLRDFVAKHGWTTLKRGTVVPPGVNLYRWVTARRVDYRADKIATWLASECERVPGWEWSVFDEAHRRNLDNLRAFTKKHGWDALATKPVLAGVRLDKWVAHRRDEYRRHCLDAWLIRGLEALPGWTWDPRRSSQERNLRELRDFVAEQGWEALRTDSVTETGTHLGLWVSNVRAMHRRDDLERWLEVALERLPGWTWEPRASRQQENIDRLARFVAKHGWDAVSDGLIVDRVKLGDWISNCRTRYRSGGLSEHTIGGLEAIPGWSWNGRTTWDQPKDLAGRFKTKRTKQHPRRSGPA